MDNNHNEIVNSKKQFVSTGALIATYKEETILEKGALEHYHESYEIAFFTKADIKIFVKNTRYNIEDGDILFIDAYDLHRITYSSTALYSRYVINFTHSYLEPFLNLYGIKDVLDKLFKSEYKKISTNLKQRQDLMNLLNIIIKLSQKQSSLAQKYAKQLTRSTRRDEQMSHALITSHLFILLSSLEILVRASEFSPVSQQTQKNIQTIISFIDNKYMEQISLDEISKTFNLSKYHISHIFKENTGFSVFEYLQHRRIIEAQKMLISNNSPDITDICYKCGFNNIQHFYRVFKKISKTTPSKYK